MSSELLDYLIVALFGGLVGAGELVSRYRDAPLRALRTGPAVLYVAINVAAAAGALGLILAFGWDFGIAASEAAQLRWTRVLVAGFASMALFRSSLFTVRVGEQDVGVGPSSFLMMVLDAADRGVDRLRAEARATEVMQAMGGVSFGRAYTALPVLCLELMQNLSDEDQKALADELTKLKDAQFDENIKTLVLGLKLMNVVGKGVLLGAVESVAQRIRTASSLTLGDPVSVHPGEVRQLVPKVVDEKGNALYPAGITWTSSDTTVVEVDAAGRLTARQPGTSHITATVDGQTAQITVTVAPPAVQPAAPAAGGAGQPAVPGAPVTTPFVPTPEVIQPPAERDA